VVVRHAETYRAGTRQTPADPAMINDLSEVAEAGPEAQVLAAEECSQMAVAFARLPRHEQELLELRVVAGLDSQQVAALMDKRAGAVRTAQSRALHRLRLQYEELMR
jgi:RNA polymerase sigma-70 factor (ECF subfamily)